MSDDKVPQVEPTESVKVEKNLEKISSSRELLSKWLNKTMKVKITDGRTLIGSFLCTDKDSNIILGACHEYVNLDSTEPGLSLLLPIEI
jgi:small nuclear ribonucleoprotein (snRNP)-like protein